MKKMKNITPEIRRRFCKDFNVPIAIFEEPYFSERLEIINMVSSCFDDWQMFKKEVVNGFDTEESYFKYYNMVKDLAIDSLKENPAFNRWNEAEIPLCKEQYPSKNLYSPIHDGFDFISVDMKKANFSTLRHFDADIFDGCETWEQWLGQFTGMRHILKSKYIRQVIMGACNPGRQVKFEKRLTADMHEKISGVEGIKLLSLSNDEIVYMLICPDGEPTKDEDIRKEAVRQIDNIIRKSDTPFFRVESFWLEMLDNDNGYIKHIYESDAAEYKCVSAENFHLIVKRELGIPLTKNDLVFRYNGKLAKYID